MPGSDSHVHLINPLWDACGGSEWRTVQLFSILSDHGDVSIWTEQQPDRAFLGHYPIQYIEPMRGRYPKDGVIVFVGVYFRIGPWLEKVKPQRAIILFNTFNEPEFLALRSRLREAGWPEPEIVFTSQYQKDQSPQYDGIVQTSPIDLNMFHVKPHVKKDVFTVGRLSRDFLLKHGRNDPALYEQLAQAGCHVSVMGGTCLAEYTSKHDNINLFDQGTISAPEFLQSLDCFLYRTSHRCTETWGRVVAEAMACGLPVVCENRGGYIDLIKHGENGFLFETNEEALEIILRLKGDVDLRNQIGSQARQTIERLFIESQVKEIVDFYMK